MLAFVGGYTDPDRQGRGRGIYVYRVDDSTGALTELLVHPDVRNPAFLALHPARPLLYAVNSGSANGVSAFSVDLADGGLSFLNQKPSHGDGPAHVSVDPAGAHVAVANYSGGTIALYPIQADGRLGDASSVIAHAGPLGPNPQRQDKAHAHQIPFDPAGGRLFVNDLGQDRTYVYRVDGGKLLPHDPPFAAANPGAGPRHLDFHPSGRFVYVINELDSTITGFAHDAGRLSPLHTVSTLPAGFDGSNSTAQIVVHPGGRFVYGSNRGHDSIAIFAIDESSGRLTPAGHTPSGGRTPRNFNVDPSGRYLYALNQDSDNIVLFRIDPASGALAATGHTAVCGSPSCIVFHAGTLPA